MCKTCKGTGGIDLEHSWGLQTYPCPDSNCDFDNQKSIQEMDETINRYKAEIYSRRLLLA